MRRGRVVRKCPHCGCGMAVEHEEPGRRVWVCDDPICCRLGEFAPYREVERVPVIRQPSLERYVAG